MQRPLRAKSWRHRVAVTSPGTRYVASTFSSLEWESLCLPLRVVEIKMKFPAQFPLFSHKLQNLSVVIMQYPECFPYECDILSKGVSANWFMQSSFSFTELLLHALQVLYLHQGTISKKASFKMKTSDCRTEWSKSEGENRISYSNPSVRNLEKWYRWYHLQKQEQRETQTHRTNDGH